MSSNLYHSKNLNPAKSEEEVINKKQSFSIKSAEFNTHKNELLVGDMMGNLIIFDCEDYKLVRKIHLSNSGIEDINISPRGSLLGVALSSGESFLCDCSRGYQKILTLENSYDDHSLKDSAFYKGVKIIQDELERSSVFELLAESRPMASAMRSSNLSKVNYQKYYVKSENALKSITVHNSNTLRLQQIYRDDLTISANPKTVYCVDGKCTSFQVHPSNDYLMVLSNIGYLYVFKIINGDLRMKVNVPSMTSSSFLTKSRPNPRSCRTVQLPSLLRC